MYRCEFYLKSILILNGESGEVKDKRTLQTFSSKSGRGCLREVGRSLSRGSKYNYLTWKLLIFWKSGR